MQMASIFFPPLSPKWDHFHKLKLIMSEYMLYIDQNNVFSKTGDSFESLFKTKSNASKFVCL